MTAAVEYQSCADLQVDGKPETYCCTGCVSDDEYGYDSFSEHYENAPGVEWAKQRVIARSCCRHHDAMNERLASLGVVQS